MVLSAATPASRLGIGFTILRCSDAQLESVVAALAVEQLRKDPPPVFTLALTCPVTAAPPTERPVVPAFRDVTSVLAQDCIEAFIFSGKVTDSGTWWTS